MSARSIGDVLWLALECAKSDRQALIDAYLNDPKAQAVRDARADIKAFERVQQRLFGTTKSQLQAMMDSMTPKSVYAILHEDDHT